jgi:hypothetical protein
LDTADKLSNNKVPGWTVFGLKAAGLLAFSEAVENTATKIVSKLAPFGEKLNVAGWVWAGGTAVHNTYRCYNSPQAAK